MNFQESSTPELEKIRQQFDQAPYPHAPFDQVPTDEHEPLFIHNLVTSYYLRHRQVLNPQGTVILDAGCGSGYMSLVMAIANPGAYIVGIDLSAESIKLARQRFQYQGISHAEFHVLTLEDIPKLGMEFDYINCDEVLYLLADPVAGLKAMKANLKPNGLIRTNLHHAYQRAPYYRAQTLFKKMGLIDEPDKDMVHGIISELMDHLGNQVDLKQRTWKQVAEAQNKDQDIFNECLGANYLLVGDKGFNIPELFQHLNAAELEFVSMVDWRHWEITDLFQHPDQLPQFWQRHLGQASLSEKLRLYELINPIHRLMDFWCAHPGTSGQPVSEWSATDWQGAIAHLHPQLRLESFRQELIQSIAQRQPFEISRLVAMPAFTPVLLAPELAACLLPLWDQPQPIETLVDRYLTLQPIHPATLEPFTAQAALDRIKTLLIQLEEHLYILLERQ